MKDEDTDILELIRVPLTTYTQSDRSRLPVCWQAKMVMTYLVGERCRRKRRSSSKRQIPKGRERGRGASQWMDQKD